MNNMYTILTNEEIAYKTYRMILFGDTSKISAPGQFINIKIDSADTFLRRPISISDYDCNTITIIYKIFGKGTEKLSKMKQFQELDILGPFGNGFTINKNAKKQLLIGGGVGVPPLYSVAKELYKEKIKFDVVLGFSSKSDVFLEGLFRSLGANVYVTTMDGSYGYKGNVLDLINLKNLYYDYYYACGPEVMLHALVKTNIEGQLSFEERMGCGFGACMGCSCKTITSYKRICKEGPVLESSEVLL